MRDEFIKIHSDLANARRLAKETEIAKLNEQINGENLAYYAFCTGAELALAEAEKIVEPHPEKPGWISTLIQFPDDGIPVLAVIGADINFIDVLLMRDHHWLTRFEHKEVNFPVKYWMPLPWLPEEKE